MQRSAVGLALAILLVHGAWLTGSLLSGDTGALRAAAAFVAVVVLLAQRRNQTPEQPAPLVAVGLLTAGVAMAAGAWLGTPTLGGAAMLCAVLGWQTSREGLPGLRQSGPLGLLAVCAWPIENAIGPNADVLLQRWTAQSAAWLVNATGLPVTLQLQPMPTLVGPQDLIVHVTAFCAGCQTFFALLTLGLVLAEAFFVQSRAKLLFIVLAPLFGFVGNVARVALSTHAANRWAGGSLWPVAHDVIGYASFCATYIGLFACIQFLRGNRPAAMAPASPRTSAGSNVQSP